MAVVTCNSTLPNSAQKTDFYGLVNNATVSSIQGTDISASANIPNTALATLTQAGLVNTSSLTGQIANANLAQLVNAALVSGAALTLLPNVPSGAGLLPAANIGGLLAVGAWTSKTVGQIYQALTDGFVLAYGSNANSYLEIVTDASSSPSVLRFAGVASTSASFGAGICCPVRKNDYYEVTSAGGLTTTMFFIALGS